MDEDQKHTLGECYQMAAQMENNLRRLADAVGRSPAGLALNATATDTWKLRAALGALVAGNEALPSSLP